MTSALRIIATPTVEARAKSTAVDRISARAARKRHPRHAVQTQQFEPLQRHHACPRPLSISSGDPHTIPRGEFAVRSARWSQHSQVSRQHIEREDGANHEPWVDRHSHCLKHHGWRPDVVVTDSVYTLRALANAVKPGRCKQVRMVPVRRLDSLLAEGVIPKADFVKMDLEGYEKDVLLGARELLHAGVLGLQTETNFAVSPSYRRGILGHWRNWPWRITFWYSTLHSIEFRARATNVH